MHLKPLRFAAVHAQYRIQIEPVSHYLGRQVRHVPTPRLPWAAGHMSTRWPRALWCSRSTPVANLSMRSQHAAEAGFAGDIRPSSASMVRCAPAAAPQIAARWRSAQSSPALECSEHEPVFVGRPEDADPHAVGRRVASAAACERRSRSARRRSFDRAPLRCAWMMRSTIIRRSSTRIIVPRRGAGRSPAVILTAPVTLSSLPAPSPCVAHPARVPLSVYGSLGSPGDWAVPPGFH